MMRRGDIILKILEVVEGAAVNAIDLFDAFLSAGYGASLGKINYEIGKRTRDRAEKNIEDVYQKQIKQRYYNFIYKLKQSDLIKEKQEGHKKIFILTKKGRDKLIFLKRQKQQKPANYSYIKEKGDRFIIVMFDIPEKERRKRAWLRSALANLDFKIIQKSVWMGKTKIPKIFLEDLFGLKLIDFVEIFEISKTGSLKQIV
ncbi:MAG TPA: CRISPR-associated endonuclease Cas2 [Candidatus Lokiarchaeia archaeon]